MSDSWRVKPRSWGMKDPLPPPPPHIPNSCPALPCAATSVSHSRPQKGREAPAVVPGCQLWSLHYGNVASLHWFFWLVLKEAVTQRPGSRIWRCAREGEAPGCPGSLAVIPASVCHCVRHAPLQAPLSGHVGLAGPSRLRLYWFPGTVR